MAASRMYAHSPIPCSSLIPPGRITDELWNIISALYLYSAAVPADGSRNIATSPNPERWRAMLWDTYELTYQLARQTRILYIYGVKKRKMKALDFEINFLTNSIRNIVSGDNFQTDILKTHNHGIH